MIESHSGLSIARRCGILLGVCIHTSIHTKKAGFASRVIIIRGVSEEPDMSIACLVMF